MLPLLPLFVSFHIHQASPVLVLVEFRQLGLIDFLDLAWINEGFSVRVRFLVVAILATTDPTNQIGPQIGQSMNHLVDILKLVVINQTHLQHIFIEFQTELIEAN